MNRKEFNKKAMTTISIFAMLLSTATPVLANVEVSNVINLNETTLDARVGEKVITFDTEEDRGGFKKLSGDGEVSFVEGQMKLQAKGVTIVGTDEQEKLDNGFMEFDITNLSQGRIGFLFRQSSATEFEGIAYDVGGSWVWIKNGETSPIQNVSKELKQNQKHHVRVEYVGNEVSLYIDNELIFTQANSNFEEKAGSVGFRVWGYDSGVTQGSCTIDNLKLGELQAPTYDEDGNFVASFDDSKNRGGFEMVNQNGSLEFVDGQGDAGYMVLSKNDNSTEKANAVSKLSPNIQDGFVEADITNQSDGRFALLFRYQNESSFVGVGYDVGGSWKIFNAQNEKNGIASNIPWNNGEKKHLRAEFVGGRVTVYLDGELAFSVQANDILGAQVSGKTGFRTWGYDVGANQGKIKIDNLKVGKFNSVLLNPGSAFVQYNEAGLYDIDISLSQTENSLQKISNKEEELQKDVDYILEGDKVTLKKEYIAKVKDNGTSSLVFTFKDGFEAKFDLQIQAKPQEEYSYERDFKNGIEGFDIVKGNADLSFNQEKGTASVKNGQDVLIIDNNVKDLYNCDVEFMFDPNNDNSNFALVTRYTSPDDWTAIGINGPAGNKSSWKIWNSKGQSKDLIQDGDRVYAKRTVPYKVRVRVLENTVTVWFDNGEVFSGEVDTLTKGTGKVGVRYWGGTGANIYNLKVNSVNLPQAETAKVEEKVLSTNEMSVKVDNLFPRVIDYTLKTGEKATGQEKPYYVVELDNTQYRPKVTADFTKDTATYHMSVEKEKGKTVTFDVILKAQDNVLSFNIDNIDDSASPIHSFNFPTHSLVSLDNTNGAELRENKYNQGTVVDLTNAKASNTYSASSLVVMNNNQIAVGFNCGSINNLRGVAYQTMQNGNKTTTGIWANGYQYRGLDGEIIEKPWSKVALGTDLNKDGKVDFQDAAIVRRDYCDKDGETADMKYSESVMRSMNTIAMNVGSGAQYPFLRILDNIKKISLGTDNFPQNIIIKGYNGQGHDSNNGDFANFNEAAGGLKDFNVLLDEAEKYNTNIGVHINHSETYPESITYKDYASTVNGWAWYDVAKQIIRENDILAEENGMESRLDDLNNATNGKLSLIYVDVYFGNRWPMYKMINKVNEMGMGIATEYVNEMDTHSVLAHHIGDTMNNAGNLARFINHQTQDVFGNSKLFRGASDRNFIGINGWQGSYDYDKTLNEFYTKVLPNRFLAQYPIMQYENENQAVLGKDLNVVTKIENGKNIITLDGKEVANGDKVFIPWTEDGKEKIYHWNPDGGQTTWKLPNSFANLDTVKVFELSDKGRGDMKEISVKDNAVTIDAKAKTGYVIYAGKESVEKTDITSMNWGEGGFVKDAGFDSYTPGYAWNVTDNVEFTRNNLGNTEITISGTKEGSLTQEITGLTPNKTYSASVWAKVSDGRTATIKVTLPNGEEVSNYMDRSNIIYGMHHTSKYKSNYQRLKVNFTASAEGKATISLLAGEGKDDKAFVNFDDVRVVENNVSDKQGHTYFEDFENTDEGYGVFLVTEADNSHLSETNEGITNDTVSGKYSLKTMYAGDYFRTAPYTVRLKPNTTYTIGLDYIAGVEGAFTVAVKSDKAKEQGDNENAVVGSFECGRSSWSKGNGQVTITTGNYDDYYVDITKKNGVEYVIDNFFVDEHVVINKDELQKLYDEAIKLEASNYTPESFEKLKSELEKAKTVLDNDKSTEEEVINAYNNLKEAVNSLEAYATEKDKEYLQSTINSMKELSLDFFKDDENWKALQDKIKQAEELLTKDTLTTKEVNTMVDELHKAKDNLVSLINKDELKSLYDLASKVVTADIVDGENATKFTSAIATAKDVLDNDKATQDMVDQALKDLDDAYSKIEPKEEAQIRQTLKEVVQKAKEINRDDYTKEQLDEIDRLVELSNSVKTWKEFDTVINGLNAILQTNVQHTIKVDENIENGTVTLSKEQAKQGEVIEITAKADEGYDLKSIKVSTESGAEIDVTIKDNSVSFVMPNENVNVFAEFEKQDTNPTPNPDPDPENPDENKPKPEDKPNQNGQGSNQQGNSSNSNNSSSNISKTSDDINMNSLLAVVASALAGMGLTISHLFKKKKNR